MSFKSDHNYQDTVCRGSPLENARVCTEDLARGLTWTFYSITLHCTNLERCEYCSGLSTVAKSLGEELKAYIERQRRGPDLARLRCSAVADAAGRRKSGDGIAQTANGEHQKHGCRMISAGFFYIALP